MKTSSSIPVRILTHNIRYATATPFKGEELWPMRAPRLLSQLRFQTLYNPEAFVCLQEVLHKQLVSILAGLNGSASSAEPVPKADEWAYIGVGRNDGRQAGEYSPIFYRPSVWHLEDSRSIWLSETPDKPSKGWDASSIRILTVGRFQHRATERQFLLLNTHLDDQGSTARLKSAELITSFIADYQKETGLAVDLPIVLTGDFNSEPTDEAYQYLNGRCAILKDIRDRIRPERRHGHDNTFTGFSGKAGAAKRIDFIFAGPMDNLPFELDAYKGYAVLENKFDDGVYISDHRAVIADLVL